MPRRGGRDRWKPHKVPPPAQRPSFVVEPTRPVDMRGAVQPPAYKHDDPVPPPEWLKPGVLVNYHAISHPRMPKGVPALRNVRVLLPPVHTGGRDWIVWIAHKGRPVPTWTLELVSEEPGSPTGDLVAA